MIEEGSEATVAICPPAPYLKSVPPPPGEISLLELPPSRLPIEEQEALFTENALANILEIRSSSNTSLFSRYGCTIPMGGSTDAGVETRPLAIRDIVDGVDLYSISYDMWKMLIQFVTIVRLP